jgi:hypothetical protein
MENKTKYILIGLGIVAVGTGAYMYTRIRRKKQANAANAFQESFSSSNLPALPTGNQSSSSSSSSGSSFPLKKGSSGKLVTTLQNALLKKFGSSILPKYGADGHFGTETVQALTSKGYPSRVDSDLYSEIILGTGTSTPPNSFGITTASISKALHQSIIKGSISMARNALKKIDDVSEYTAVNTIFKKTRVGLVRKTLVTGLLDRFNSTDQKKLLNQEFYRIGLKYDGSKWSLSGILGAVMDQLITIQATKVWDESGLAMTVPKGTILGEYLDANDGTTEFETLDRKRLFVQTTSIRYV